jgi:arsenate reductase (glutaredoxin)
VTGVQIFGVKNSQATRAAERFFKERRVQLQFIDLTQKPMAPGEIRRFLEKFQLSGLIDTTSKFYIDAGLQYLRQSESEMLTRIEREPRLLRLPLVRAAKSISIGHDEAAWLAMVSAGKS